MISSPADRKKIKDAMDEISASMTRIEAEKDLIKEIIVELNDNFKISKKILNKMAKTYHKQNFINEQQDHEEFETLYSEVVELKSDSV
jgi:uncharacterized FlgJ-related protein